jgi:ion channel-forming bestrophin family protein
MHAGHHYNLGRFAYWTRRDIYALLILGTVPTILYEWVGWKWIALPWVPIALLGTAAAFLVGFKNTQTYNRSWEARQIYGAIVNTSRAWGMMASDMVANHAAHQTLIYRHVAWLTALRFQLREPRAWENLTKSYNKEYSHLYHIPEREGNLEEELKGLLSEEELHYVLSKKNRATHLIHLQSKQLTKLRNEGQIEALNFVEMENLLVNLYEQQGKCERIKNFPYPRQFASINMYFVHLFILTIPFGLLNEFQKIGDKTVWLTIPFTIIVGWVFSSIERVGEATENPFEGGANDVPITSISRTIEIDLREMLNETNLPPAITPTNEILM